MNEEIMEIATELIVVAGNSKSLSMLAIKEAKKGNFEKAIGLMNQSKEEIIKAHSIQTNLIVRETNEEKIDINLLLIHAEDHLNSALIIKEIALEIIELYKRVIV